MQLHPGRACFETRSGFAGALLSMTRTDEAFRNAVTLRRRAKRGLEGRTVPPP